MTNEKEIRNAITLIREALPPGSSVVLFGSQARGSAHTDSDIDLMIIEPYIKERRKESARLSRLLRPARLSADIIVYDRETYDEWAAIPGTLIHDVAREGLVLYEN